MSLRLLPFLVPQAAAPADNFPVVLTSTTHTETSNATTREITPPTSLVEGNLLILILGRDGGGTNLSATDDGFTHIGTIENEGTVGLLAAWKIITGSEPSTYTITSSSERVNATFLQISGHDSGKAPTATYNQGGTGNADPASHAGGGSDDKLYIAGCAVDRDTVSAFPSNMANGPELNVASDGANGVTVASDTEESTASSFNPSNFTNTTDGWCGVTISVFPVSVAFEPDADAFRFYSDGTESGSSPKAAQDIDITLDPFGNAQFHVRFRVQNQSAVAGASTDDYQLQVSKNSGSYASVTASSPDVQADTASGLTADGVTTNRGTNGITDGTGSFVAGEQEETDGEIEDRQLTASNFTEHVYACKLVAADLGSNDTLDFRLALNGGAPGMTNTVVPRITASRAANLLLQRPPLPFDGGSIF